MSKTSRTYQPGDRVIITDPCEPWARIGEEFILQRCDIDGDWHAYAVKPRYAWPICIGPPTDFRIASKPKVDRDGLAWCVIVHCRTRKHAREAYNNIDNGLRLLSIGRRDALGSFAIARRLNGGKMP